MIAQNLKTMAETAAGYRKLQGQHINAALAQAEDFRDSDEQEAEALGGRAADLEMRVLAGLVGQPYPVCPHCFDVDDDLHEALQTNGEASMLVECCACGGLYIATGKPVTVWTTRKYPG